MEDKELKELLSKTKMTAKANLKVRIMHQINSEKALTPAVGQKSKPTAEYDFSIFGIMYLLLILLFGYSYFRTDTNPFQSTSVLISAIFIASSFSIYWLIINYLDSRKISQNKG